MIGGDTEITKSILRVDGSPPSLPSFVSEVGFAFARYVNEQSLDYAGTGRAEMPLVDPEGSRRALQAEIGGFSEGSDHQVWAEGSCRVPVIYIADWPDRYIHTQRDVPANLDPTKLRRAIFIAAASGWYLANAGADRGDQNSLWPRDAGRGDRARRGDGAPSRGASGRGRERGRDCEPLGLVSQLRIQDRPVAAKGLRRRFPDRARRAAEACRRALAGCVRASADRRAGLPARPPRGADERLRL